MASSSVFHFFLLSIALFSVSCLSATNAPNTKQKHFFTLPIKKDPSTNLFYTSLGIGTPLQNFNLVIDLLGETLWYSSNKNYNSSSYSVINCDSNTCNSFGGSGCLGCIRPAFRPGCTNNTCVSEVINQFATSIYLGGLGEDVIAISQTQVHGLLSSCIYTDESDSSSPLEGLPKTSRGIIGLAKSQLALPNQLALANKVPTKFSLCLPSSNKQGYTNLLVGANGGEDYSKFVQTTPLIVNHVSTGASFEKGVPSKEYFIDVKSIKIDGKAVKLKPSLLSIDKKGNGGTKFSTMSPFTELESTVYKTFIRDFLKKASDRRVKRVASVPPFEACFDSSTTGFALPTIDLVLQGGVEWTIHGSNSMVMAKKNVACLAFVDGGTEPRNSFVKASIVIGGHQLMDNLLVFDLAASKLSFSNSLFLHNSSCSYL